MSRARLVLHTKYIDEQGGLVEMKAYRVPRTASAPHGFKYSLVYIRDGRRLIGYDNHERRGDHRHYRAVTEPYGFTTVEQLIADFLRDMAAIKKELGQ